ncbi:PLP-dependent aminotransferase family protein [Paenibacillus filicis]|uniref:PLP-dependent aminotransferase family protein n=1 Tax=Paenibacillus gyeongsangnamensis TaxID=3388067 RepID=A0ABT4QFA5_9BACL|nr:PLP-dependent aminotransferase family protein [Paenibacillus filicis]MCZ8515559.1 PLP-dependent aminotransferase family protein [Paenibacillus filicis]
MKWTPVKGAGRAPVYKQIAAYIESQIADGAYPEGSVLPSERELAKELGVNRSTVVAAYDELKSYGLVSRVRGSGTIVGFRDTEEARPAPSWESFLRGGVLAPNNRTFQTILTEVRSSQEHINFAMGELHPELSPKEWIGSLLASGTLGYDLGYEPTLGNEELRESICAHLGRFRDIRSTPSSILVTSGAQQALHLIVQCLLKPGDAVAIEDPSYAYSLPLFHSSGLRTILLPSGPSGVDPEEVAQAYLRYGIKMVFLNPNYQNPTGSLMNVDNRRSLLDLSSRYGFAIVEDDPYSLIGFGDKPAVTLKSMDAAGSVLYISSLSKIVASGLRIGWISGPRAIVERLADAKQQLDFGQSTLPQQLAARILSSDALQDHLDRLRISLQFRRDVLADALRGQFKDRVELRLPEGGIHLWCGLEEEKNSQRLFVESLRRGVIYTPGSLLGTSHRHVRLTFSRPDLHSIEEGVRRFYEAYMAT